MLVTPLVNAEMAKLMESSLFMKKSCKFVTLFDVRLHRERNIYNCYTARDEQINARLKNKGIDKIIEPSFAFYSKELIALRPLTDQ